MLDTRTEFGARAQRRLRNERVAWLVTVGADGTPQPNPVWFLWDGETVLIYSQPNAQRLRNIARRPRVALHFDTDGEGGDVVVVVGEARVDPAAPPANEVPAYVEKYREGIASIGLDPASMARSYSRAIRVRPTKVRGF